MAAERKLCSEEDDAFVVFLMSHGCNGFIFGRDGDKLSIDSLVDMFDGTHCPALRGKPKLFFIQACQGSKTLFNLFIYYMT